MASVPDGPAADFHLFETLRHEADGLRCLDRHLRRLTRSAEHLGFTFDPDAARTLLLARTAGVADARVRLSAHRDGQLAVEVGPLPGPTDRPVVLAVDIKPIDSSSWWLQHKTSWREPYDVRRSRHPRADDVVLLNERGELTETTIANLAVHLDGRWWTPPLGAGCLPGVERSRLLERGALEEQVLRPDDLESASGLAVVSSLRGWRPAALATHCAPGTPS